jgi:hypothetical protein
MYRLRIVDINKVVVFEKCFLRQKHIIEFTNHKITYNDFKKRTHEKRYRTYKDYFEIHKI